MKGRMAYPAKRHSGKHRPASTARTLPAQRTWLDELRRIELQEDADVGAGAVVRRYHRDGAPTYVRYMPPETEEQRAFVLSELQDICDYAKAQGFVDEHAVLIDEIERVRHEELTAA